jgi:hypothetical protein
MTQLQVRIPNGERAVNGVKSTRSAPFPSKAHGAHQCVDGGAKKNLLDAEKYGGKWRCDGV